MILRFVLAVFLSQLFVFSIALADENQPQGSGLSDAGLSASEVPVEPSAAADSALETEGKTIVPVFHPVIVTAQVSWLGLAVPHKSGFGFAYRFDRKWAIDISYLTGTYGFSSSFIDVGGFHEEIFIVDARYSVFSGSFNLLFGLADQRYQANVGNDILQQVSQNNGDVSLLNVETIGLNLGLGNRFVLKRFVLGIDWLVLNFPVRTLRADAPVLNYISDSPTRSRIDGALKIMRYLPTEAVFKLAIGIAF